MLDDLFTRLTVAMGDSTGIALLAAAGWGVLSILLSPCHLSSVPLVVGYISSQEQNGTVRPYLLSLIFATGILITIGLVGVVTAAAGRMMGDVGVWGNLVVAGVFFIVGLYFLDVIHMSWQSAVPRTSLARGWKGALLLGLIFGIGLGPCTFAYMAPVLGVVFSVASTNPLEALGLIAAFGIGHCTVIAGAGGSVGTVQRYLHWTGRSTGALWMKRVAGVMVMLGGVYYLYTAF